MEEKEQAEVAFCEFCRGASNSFLTGSKEARSGNTGESRYGVGEMEVIEVVWASKESRQTSGIFSMAGSTEREAVLKEEYNCVVVLW